VAGARAKISGAVLAPASNPATESRERELAMLVASLAEADKARLLLLWRNHLGGTAPAHLPLWLLARLLAFRLQTQAFGDVGAELLRRAQREAGGNSTQTLATPFMNRPPATREGVDLRPGALLAREWKGRLERVTALEGGFAWNGKTYRSLSQVAKAITGTNWNGHRFFGLRAIGEKPWRKETGVEIAAKSAAARSRRNPGATS
jgi:hypothetical protein